MSLASAAGASGTTGTKKYTRSRGRAKKEVDPYASAYGVVPSEMFRGGPWTRIIDLGEAAAGVYVRVFGTVWSVRPLSRTRAIVVVLNSSSTVRCVVDAAGSNDGVVTTRMVRFAATLSTGYAIDVEGVVSLPDSGRLPLVTSQQVEIQVRKLHPIGLGVPFQPQDRKSQRPCKSISPRPSINLEDNAVEQEGENLFLMSLASATGASGTKKYTRSRGRAKKEVDPYASAYGVVPSEMFRGGPWTRINDLGEAAAGVYVRVFGTVWSVRPLSRTRAIVVVLNSSSTVRCVVDAAGSNDGVVTTRMVRFAATLSTGYAIDVEGVVSLPDSGRLPLATSQQVEIQVRKLHPIGLGVPFQPQNRKSQRPCKSITPRPSINLEDNAVEQEGESSPCS